MTKALDREVGRDREPVQSLVEISSGRFRIVTSHDTVYEVDLDKRMLLRKSNRSTMPGLMLKGEAPVVLLHILACAVGAQGRFVVDLRHFGAGLATRVTATVLEINAARPAHTSGDGGSQ